MGVNHCDRHFVLQKTDGDSITQHNFIESLEATSIYKQGNGSLKNVKIVLGN